MSYDLGTAHGKIVLEYDGDKAVNKAERDINKLDKKSKETDKSVSKLGSTLGKIGSGVKMGALVSSLAAAGAQAGALSIQLLGMVPSLVSMVSLSAALPGLYTAAAVSVGVLKAAFAGVSDTIKAAFDTENPDKFNEALKKLAPNAQGFAKALHDNVPALKAVQQGIQNAFFENGFEALVPRLVAGLQRLQPVLNGLSFQFGEIAQRVARFALSSDSIGFVEDAVNRFRAQLTKITPIIEPILTGLRSVGTVGLPLLDRMGSAVASLGQKFADWLTAISQDGRLQGWIDTALQTFKQLGDIIKNVFSILNSVMSAAQDTGGGLLGTLGEITGQFAAFLKSAEGADAIRTLFSGILSVAKQLAPSIIILVKALAKALGPAMSRIAEEVGPVLIDVINELTPAFGPLANAIADVLVALAPLIPPIAKLVAILATGLAGGISALAKALGPTISMLSGGFMAALEGIMPLIQQALVTALPIAAKAGVQLATALAPLIPAIIEFGLALAQALLPYLPQLLDSTMKLLPPLVQLATLFAEQLSGSLRAIIPYLPMIIGFFVQMQANVMTVLAAVLAFSAVLVKFGQTLQRLPEIIAAAVGAFIGIILSAFNRAVSIVVGLAGRIGNALSNLGPTIWAKVTDAWNRARDLFSSGVSRAESVAKSLPGRIGRAIVALSSTVANLARAAWNALVAQFNSGRSRAEATARALPGRIRSALGNIGSILIDSGRQLINGLIRGISSGISRVLNMVRNLAYQVSSAFNNAMSIFSPSKVMFESGVHIDEGVIEGMRSKLRDVGAMSSRLAQTVINPTVALPSGVAGALSVGQAARPAAVPATLAPDQPRSFGPYNLVVDGGVIASIVIDTITGNPTVVSKAADEGTRADAWAGSGRRSR